MRVVIRLAGAVVGILAFILTIPGVKEAAAASTAKGSWLHTALTTPLVYVLLVAGGVLVLAYTWADIIVDWKIARAGGITKREFPAHLSQWDKVKNLAVWQVQWLWNGFEPVEGDTTGTRAYSVFRHLKENLAAGLIKDAAQVDGSWVNTTLSRQQWVDYA